MKPSSIFLSALLASALLLPACAAPKHTNEPPTKDDIRANAKRLAKQKDHIDIVENDRNCIDSDIQRGSVRVRTCLVHSNIGRAEYMNYETVSPQVTTVVHTPQGSYSAPLAWTVEIRKDGEVIVRQAITGDPQEAIERDGSLEVQSSIPLGDFDEIQPGDYEVIYTPDDQSEEPIRSIITVPENKDAEAPVNNTE